MKTYIREFNTEKEARNMMELKNRSLKLADNQKELYCLVNGPSSNFAVIDLKTAIELKSGYTIN